MVGYFHSETIAHAWDIRQVKLQKFSGFASVSSLPRKLFFRIEYIDEGSCLMFTVLLSVAVTLLWKKFRKKPDSS
jgi:hypothetical protein